MPEPPLTAIATVVDTSAADHVIMVFMFARATTVNIKTIYM